MKERKNERERTPVSKSHHTTSYYYHSMHTFPVHLPILVLSCVCRSISALERAHAAELPAGEGTGETATVRMHQHAL